MPFKSKAQRKWMHATKPDMARRWEAEAPPTTGKLPEHAKTKKKSPKK